MRKTHQPTTKPSRALAGAWSTHANLETIIIAAFDWLPILSPSSAE